MLYINEPPQAEWEKLCQRYYHDDKDVGEKVGHILKEVKENGDEAVKKFSLEFDKIILNDFKVSTKEILDARSKISKDLGTAIKRAFKNIKTFHLSQKDIVKKVVTMPGIMCWRKSVAIEKVGLYIPGGTAPLFSTLLMLGIPATIAGCSDIIVCSPPGKDGALHPALLFTASILGIKDIYKVGGAQAIAAMAYGTQSIQKVQKIFGPGNQYVTAAKLQVSVENVAIDLPAGPSELVVYADDTCIPAYVAADLLSQAEHGIDSEVILVSHSQKTAQRIEREMLKQIKLLNRKEIIERCLEHALLVVIKDPKQAFTFINYYAPEHLVIASEYSDRLARYVVNAGSVFLGNHSPESAGDYASGTNHTLPTNGNARAYSGVSLDSFVKKITFQKISKRGLKKVNETVQVLANAEGMQAHANAISQRIKK